MIAATTVRSRLRVSKQVLLPVDRQLVEDHSSGRHILTASQLTTLVQKYHLRLGEVCVEETVEVEEAKLRNGDLWLTFEGIRLTNTPTRLPRPPAVQTLIRWNDLLPSPSLRKKTKKLLADQQEHIHTLRAAGRDRAASWNAGWTYVLWAWYVLTGIARASRALRGRTHG